VSAKFQTADEVLSALRLRYPAKEFAFLRNVGNATGGALHRWADVVVMNLWPSRGLEITGIEIKISRQDWLNELRRPEKAESCARHCDRWYLAVGDEEIVKPGELPKAWRLLAPRGDGLVCKLEAPLQKRSDRLNRWFIAALLRRAQEQMPAVAAIEEARDAGFKEGREQGESNAQFRLDEKQRELQRLGEKIAAFEKASGVSIQQTWDGARVGDAVRSVLSGTYLFEQDRLKRLLVNVELIADSIKKAMTSEKSEAA